MVPDAIDPSFQDRGHRPPPHGKHEYRCGIAGHPTHLCTDRGRILLVRIGPVGVNHLGEHRIKLLAYQVRPFDVVATRLERRGKDLGDRERQG